MHQCRQTQLTSKLDEILMLLRANMTNNSLNVSLDVLQWVKTNTSTPLPGMQSVTIVPVEDVVMEVPGTSAAEPTSLIFHSKAQRREIDDHFSPPARKVLFATVLSQNNRTNHRKQRWTWKMWSQEGGSLSLK